MNLNTKIIYKCPMHPEIQQEQPGTCPKCGMNLVKTEMKADHQETDHSKHLRHSMKPISKMSVWERFKMSMTMTMGMDHTGLAGREMARLMELDIRTKFIVSLILTVPIVLYSSLGKNILGFNLPAPIPENWLMLLLTTPVYFYCGWIFLYSTYVALFKQKTLNMAVLIAVGITAAYVFSIILTLLGSEE